MSSFRERNDRSKPSGKPFSRDAKGAPKGRSKPPAQGAAPSRDEARPPAHAQPHRRPRRSEPSNDWLWGWHAVQAALANPNREGFKRLLVTPTRAHEIAAAAGKAKVRFEQMEGPDISRHLPAGAVHQGIALLADPLEGDGLEAFIMQPEGVLVMLDQLTDPQNVGAIFRSAAAFGARGLILQDRNAPALTGALAKAAAGAVDALPHARVVNLSRALEQLAEAGWRAVGLDGTAEQTLDQALDARPTVLVLGSEGEGLRRLVAEHCDVLAKIPMPGGFESLNVSNAAAVALYEASRKQG
ncbi:MAG: 23S rRNA (guanosine(2251)-2'-O)-methyltransferase RlmB [Caulobacteraceae bacterium]